MKLRLFTLLIATLFITLPALADDAVVRILFFTGEVTVTSGGATKPALIGRDLTSRDIVTIKGKGTLQLSINGKVVKYSKPAQLKISDVIKRAGKGENSAVANSLRTLAAASGAARSARTSQAGATRATDTSHLVADAKRKGLDAATTAANDELARRTGIDDPLNKARQVVDAIQGDDLIIVEPRSTAVSVGPIKFRWMRIPSVTKFTVTVKNYLGDEVYRTETSDTSAIWPNPTIDPDAVYTWTLTNSSNMLNRSSASFHRLNSTAQSSLAAGETAIRKEIGGSADDPALLMLLGAHYADNECYGEAARYFTQSALKSPQHYREFMDLAREQYQYNMFMSDTEVAFVCGN